jgi:hypothetical protein
VRALCVGRHRYLSDHLGLFFSAFGLQTAAAVGLDDAVRMARRERPDVVLCEYDLLAMLPLDAWEHDELLARTPVLAVSLSRRPEEANLLDVNGIAGFVYLPLLQRADFLRLLAGVTTVRTPDFSLLGPVGSVARETAEARGRC